MDMEEPFDWSEAEVCIELLLPVHNSENKEEIAGLIDDGKVLLSNGSDNNCSEPTSLSSILPMSLISSTSNEPVQPTDIAVIELDNGNNDENTMNIANACPLKTVESKSESHVQLPPACVPPSGSNAEIVAEIAPKTEIPTQTSNQIDSKTALKDVLNTSERVSVRNENIAKILSVKNGTSAKSVRKVRGRRAAQRDNHNDNLSCTAYTRPKRTAAPTNLTEPTLKAKMRRNF